MKKQRLISLIITTILILIIFTGCTSKQEQTTERTQSVNVQDSNSETTLSTDGDWDDDEDDNHTQSNTSSDLLSEEEIRSIVEKHTASLKGKNMTMELDSDDGIKVYEVDVRTSTHKYEFEINASSGEIVSYGEELLQKNAKNNSSSSIISEKKVRTIVEKHTTALKGQDLIIERDTDDSIKVYEVEGHTSSHKYEFEINAYTGEIISYDEEGIN